MAFENKDIFNAVAASALDQYGLEKTAEAKLIIFSENATYRVEDCETDAIHGILRVSRPNYHTAEEINSEILWIKQIRRTTPIVVPDVRKGLNGEFVQQVKGMDGRIYFAVMFEYLEGDSTNEDDEKKLIKQFEYLGEATAYLHSHTTQWKGINELQRHTWDYDTIIGDKAFWGDWRDFPGISDEDKSILQETTEIIKFRISRYPKSDANYGLIHSDLRTANMLVEDGQVKLIDFDDCGFGYFLYDLAGALSFIEEKPIIPELIKAWLKGYQKLSTVSKEDIDEIDTFIMLRRLQMTAWLVSHRESEPAAKYSPGWLKNTVELAERYNEKMIF